MAFHGLALVGLILSRVPLVKHAIGETLIHKLASLVQTAPNVIERNFSCVVLVMSAAKNLWAIPECVEAFGTAKTPASPFKTYDARQTTEERVGGHDHCLAIRVAVAVNVLLYWRGREILGQRAEDVADLIFKEVAGIVDFAADVFVRVHDDSLKFMLLTFYAGEPIPPLYFNYNRVLTFVY